jgi:uncharacterized protein
MKILVNLLLIGLVGGIGWFLGRNIGFNENKIINLAAEPTPVPTPFSIYSIESLSKANVQPGKLQIIETLEENEKFNSYKFKLTFDPEIESGNYKTTTGQINIPNTSSSNYPLVIMFRGYVDQNLYVTGMGTSSGAKVFAENGFITVAPDFLGYGESDQEADNIFESRFQTYTTALSLLKSIDQINNWNHEDVFIWAHSNGGQIALTVLEATGVEYPTTLWAPVTKPFPYSVLYYTDESPDRGRFIRQELARFEELYNPDLFTITDYVDRIKAPIQLHQGTADDAIPVEWSNQFIAQLKNAEVEHLYFIYPGADHNLRPSWDTVIERDIEFFKKHL